MLIGYKNALAQAYTADRSADGSLSGQINVSYDLSDNALVYGNWARGYKSGGINMAGSPAGRRARQSAAQPRRHRAGTDHHLGKSASRASCLTSW